MALTGTSPAVALGPERTVETQRWPPWVNAFIQTNISLSQKKNTQSHLIKYAMYLSVGKRQLLSDQTTSKTMLISTAICNS